MTNAELVIPLDPNPDAARKQWKAAKQKHAGAIAAKKIKFAQDLGTLLDQRATLWATVHKLQLKSKNAREKQQEKEAERKGTKKELTPAQRVVEVKAYNEGLAARKTALRTALKALSKHAAGIEKVAGQYKVKITGLGDPAEADLMEMLDFVIDRAQADISLAAKFA